MVTGQANQEKKKARTDMLEAFANIILMAGMLALGAILFVVVCAMIGWAIFTMQNGGIDE
jgi:hypothetical protein